MPRAKREKVISLTKVKKKTRETKKTLLDEVRSCAQEYKNAFVFSIENMRSSGFLQVRQHFKTNSRFFFGKNNVMAVALGRDQDSEISSNLHKISMALKGQRGLMFTNVSPAEVKKYFEEFSMSDFARAGDLATETIDLEEGPLPQFPFSIEPQLRKLGMPTKLDKGEVQLYQPFHVCTEGQAINVEQAKILKLLKVHMSTFRVVLLRQWNRESGKVTDLAEADD